MSNGFNIAHNTSMEFIRGLHNLHKQHRGCVATIGNFDGIHLGHQAIIQQLKFAAKSHKLPAVVVTFEPQPQEFFMPDRAPARLMRIREKIEYLGQHYIDRMVCLRFDKILACLSPEDFVRQILVESLGVKDLAVGDDFRFGKDRRGDFSTLQLLGGRLGFEVECTVTCKVNDRRISSTWVREALAAGDLE
ncbi:MAG: hypothetical protein HY356_01715, partial [Gammaproteobacteria bacterium]|nr:hypothetical protein [Gammaproteobacteria bacterium]